MKRLYIVLTVFLSSFLLLSIGEVKADTYNQEIDLSLIDTNFFTLKSNVNSFLANDSTYSDYYVILYNYSDSRYEIYVYKSDVDILSPYAQITSSVARMKFSYVTYRYYSDSSFNIIFDKRCGSGAYMDVYNNNLIFVYSNFSFGFIDTSFNNPSILNLTFNNRTWTCSSVNGDSFLSLYDVYVDYYGEQEEPEPVDNTPILTDFYSIIIEKIGYLCGVIVSNYIYLSIFVIILIIILFELIFRRRL